MRRTVNYEGELAHGASPVSRRQPDANPFTAQQRPGGVQVVQAVSQPTATQAPPPVVGLPVAPVVQQGGSAFLTSSGTPLGARVVTPPLAAQYLAPRPAGLEPAALAAPAEEPPAAAAEEPSAAPAEALGEPELVDWVVAEGDEQ